MPVIPPIHFHKMHGSGNDFVVVSLPDDALTEADLSAFAQSVCRRGTSVGADGVIAISPSTVADFRWRYINADGSDGDMCGNGAMVGARYAVDQGIATSPCTFETAVGNVCAIVEGQRVTLSFIDAELIGTGLQFDEMPGVAFDHMMIGVPHVVGFVDDADAISDLDRIGRAIRNDHQLAPAGANVNLVHRLGDNAIRMRTYERGVEAETLACGTGAVCSAIAAVRAGMVSAPVSVRVSSGMDLVVSWRQQGERSVEITLAGHALVVAQGEILAEALT